MQKHIFVEIRDKEDLKRLMYFCQRMSEDPELEECVCDISAKEKKDAPKTTQTGTFTKETAKKTPSHP